MFENVRKNKFESGIIVAIFIVVITLIVYYICHALNLGTMSIVIALIFSIASAWGSYYYSDKIVLSVNKARPATKEEDLKLVNILDALMVTSGLPLKPRLYVVDDAQPNAFATGRNPQNAVICVTTGLLEKLDYYELEGVIAHEMSHIKNYDIRLSCIVSVMVGFIVMISDNAQPNAFATGRNPQNAVICVTTGLLEKLDYYELEGVIAHEMSHIKNYDIRLSCIVSVMVGFIVMISDMFSRALFWGGLRDDDNDSDNRGNAILMVLICSLELYSGVVLEMMIMIAIIEEMLF